MDIKQIRVNRLKDFVESNDGAANMARKWPDLDPSYLSQLINGHRGFGEKAARKIEGICNLPINYFDVLELKQDRAKYLIDQVVDQMTESQKNQLLKIAITLTEPEANGNQK
jgi:hypothetical protein